MPLPSRPVGIGPEWLMRQQLGFRPPLGSALARERQFATSFDYNYLSASLKYGGIFSLEYSPRGNLLVASTEQYSLVFFDPLREEEVHVVPNAHVGCVNGVKFIDENTIVSFSDDKTLVVRDLRNVNRPLHDLLGHDNWVKSVDNIGDRLISSGFDGAINAWDIKEEQPKPRRLMKIDGLMRTRLSPDKSKLVISTASGYIIVVHNLDTDDWHKNLTTLRPNMYRLMQVSNTPLRACLPYTPLFKGYGKTNRIEFVADFPKNNQAEIISSITIHPDGQHLLSRNTSHKEQNEYTCLHSILELHEDEGENMVEIQWPYNSRCPSQILPPINHQQGMNSRNSAYDEVWEAMIAIFEARNPGPQSFRRNISVSVSQISPAPVPAPAPAPAPDPDPAPAPAPVSVENLDGREVRLRAAHERITNLKRAFRKTHIMSNKKKGMLYIVEANIGNSYIKEPSFSKNGQVICSPFKNGVRFLAMSPRFEEASQVKPSDFEEMFHVAKVVNFGPYNRSHNDYVLSTKFSPIDGQLVAGTQCGKIVIMNPFRM